MNGWIARDEDGTLYLYIKEKPYKEKYKWYSYLEGAMVPLSRDEARKYKDVQWKDKEPKFVKVTIEAPVKKKVV